MNIKMHFNHIDIGKASVCFTWDDNFLSHSRIIAPQFLQRRMRCTFYINPGEAGFEEKYLLGYLELSKNQFEIGSHGFNHDNYSDVSPSEFERELEKAAIGIKNHLGVYPATFAFPYHDFNEETLNTARRYHLETRNTLGNSQRFGIRSASALDEMVVSVNECISKNYSLVFSGHSAVSDNAKGGTSEESGYEPIRLSILSALLDHLQTLQDSIEVLTFQQAALKEYIMNHCTIVNDSYILDQEQMDWLSMFQIGDAMLSRLI